MDRIENLSISDTGFVFDPCSGATFSANETALCILGGLKRGLTITQVCKHLIDRFGAGAVEARRDLEDFMRLLESHGLSEGEV